MKIMIFTSKDSDELLLIIEKWREMMGVTFTKLHFSTCGGGSMAIRYSILVEY